MARGDVSLEQHLAIRAMVMVEGFHPCLVRDLRLKNLEPPIGKDPAHYVWWRWEYEQRVKKTIALKPETWELLRRVIQGRLYQRSGLVFQMETWHGAGKLTEAEIMSACTVEAKRNEEV